MKGKRGIFFGLLLAYACSGGGSAGGGCGGACGGAAGGGCAPVPGGFPNQFPPKIVNAIQTRVSRAGFDYIQNNISEIIGAVAGGNGQNFAVPCSSFHVSTPSMDLLIGDQNRNFNCDLGEAAQVNVRLENLRLDPVTQKTLKLTTRLYLDTGRIYITSKDQEDCVCGDLGCCAYSGWCEDEHIEMWITFNTNSPWFGGDCNFMAVGADVNFNIETDENGRVLTFDVPVDQMTGLENCDQNHNPNQCGNKDSCFDPNDLDFDDVSFDGMHSGNCYTTAGGTAIKDFMQAIGVWDNVVNYIFDRIRPQVKSAIQAQVDKQKFEACGAQDPCQAGVCCSDDFCHGPAAAGQNPSCSGPRLPRQMGMEGRAALSDTLGSFGVPDTATMDVYVNAGGQVKSDGTWSITSGASNLKTDGLQIGVIGGSRGGEMDSQGLIIPTDCAPIPSGGFPARPEPAAIPFHSEASPSYRDTYHLALGVSDYYLDKTMYDLYAAGGLCLSIGSATSSFLTSALFRTFFGSLGMLADGNDVPMIVAVRPKAPPDIEIGENTFKLVDGVNQPDKPLITFTLPKLNLDFYALIEDRYVRLFTLKAKVSLPLGIEFDPSGSALTPVPGELKGLFSELETTDSELLAEDTSVIVDLLGAVIGLAQPFVAGALQPIELPTLLDGKFALRVRDAKGVVPYGTPIPGFQHVALYAELAVGTGSSPALYAADTRAEIVERRVPTRETLRGPPGTGLVKPVAVVRARALTGRAGPVEFSFRIDGGFWSPWIRRDTFEVSSPVLLLQGWHHIDVRARHQDEPATADPTPEQLAFLVDWESPVVKLVPDDEAAVLRAVAKDAVSPADKMRYEWRLDEGAWQALEKPEIPLDQIQGHAVEVAAADEAGNRAAARFVAHGMHQRTGGTPSGCGGCGGEGAASAWVLAGLLALFARARPRRRA